MRTTALYLSLAATLLLPACDSQKSPGAPVPEERSAAKADTPLLPVSKGHSWIYQVRLHIPAGVTSPGAAEVSTKHRRVRTYIGKVAAAAGLPETDCFEVVVTGAPDEREFVEIHDDRILMRGSLIMRPETTTPMWLDQPVPFVIAGMKPGTALPGLKTMDGSLSRETKVIAREDLTVPAGAFNCIRLLTTGNDGEIELRRTVWFAPGKGIIKEEKARYRRDQLILRETQELVELRFP